MDDLLSQEGWASSPLWVNGGVLAESELERLRASGVDITNFTRLIDSTNAEAIDQAVCTIREHHPNENVWVEYLLSEPVVSHS